MKLEDYTKYYIQGSDHYLIPKDVFKELFNEMVNWKEETIELKKQNSNFKTALDEGQEIIVDYIKENQELKKQLENAINSYTEEHNLRHNSDLKLDVLKTQQKEFIKFLEDGIKNEKTDLEQLCKIYKIPKENNSSYKFVCSYINKLEEILQKYKEIIGEEQ